MARFPHSNRKTMRRKMSPEQQANACDALAARLGAGGNRSAYAMMRGIPENPVFVKDEDALNRTDVALLRNRATRRLNAEKREFNARVAAAKTCVHEFSITPGVRTKACVKCGTVAMA